MLLTQYGLGVGVNLYANVPAADRDRVKGMAESQAEMVHQGVVYDLEVDTTQTEALACARTIAAHVG